MPAPPPGFLPVKRAKGPAPPPGFVRATPTPYTPKSFDPTEPEPTLTEQLFGGSPDHAAHEPGILPSLGRTLVGDAPLGETLTRLPGNIASKFGSMVTQQVAGAEA